MKIDINCSTKFPVGKGGGTHRFLMSVAPLNAFLGMDWMKFSLRSLWKQYVGISNT